MSKTPENYIEWEQQFKGSKKSLTQSKKDPEYNNLGFTQEEFKEYLRNFKLKILYPAMKKSEEIKNDVK